MTIYDKKIYYKKIKWDIQLTLNELCNIQESKINENKNQIIELEDDASQDKDQPKNDQKGNDETINENESNKKPSQSLPSDDLCDD